MAKKGASKGKSEHSEVTDPRFTSMYSAPIFKKHRKEDSKVKLDSRFGSVLTDKRFRSAPGAVDKYGRKSKKASTKAAKQELEQFYSIEEKNENDESMEEKDKNELLDKNKAETRLDYLNKLSRGEISESSDESASEEVEDGDDKASDEESDDSDSDNELADSIQGDAEEVLSDDEEAPTGDSSSRLAIQRLDWDNMTAEDIMVVMQSFCPTGSEILNVTVYPSDYGKEQMEHEAKFGPKFLSASSKGEVYRNSESSDEEDDIYDAVVGDHDDDRDQKDKVVADRKTEGNVKSGKMKGADFVRKGKVAGLVIQEELVRRGKADKSTLEDQESDRKTSNGASSNKMENGGVNAVALRRYELNKLKYYFAVAECDSVETADAVYKELDGMEFENSSMIFDLRFVPNDLDFGGREVRDSTSSITIAPNYQPPEFVVQALQHTNVECTWDEGDRERGRKLGQSFGKWKELNESELQQYLASDSEDSEVEPSKASKHASSKKVRTLLLGDGDDDDEDEDDDEDDDFFVDADENDKNDSDVDKEYSFVPTDKGNGKTAEDVMPASDETPFEKTMRKLAEKKKSRKLAVKAKKAGKTVEEYVRSRNEANGEFDMYVDEAGSNHEAMDRHAKSKMSKNIGSKDVLNKDAASKEELGLMFGDTEEEDYDMRGIVKAQKDKGAKAKRKKNRNSKKDEESGASGAQKDFSINVNDDRFSRMMEGDARFGIDPLAPEFKDTDAMRTIMGEQKLRRKQREKSGKTKRNDPTGGASNEEEGKRTEVDVSALKDRLKRRKR